MSDEVSDRSDESNVQNDEANDRDDESRRRVHPKGHCQNCGEPLRFVPCLNCAALRELETERD